MAPKDRERHLQSCYDMAQNKKRDKVVRMIQKMMRREANQRQWGRIRSTMCPQKGVWWQD